MPVLDISSIKRYFASQPVQKAWLFGSFARGEQSDDSDVDILVQFDGTVGLFKYASISSDLEELLGRNVDLVGNGTLFPWVRDEVERDKILIYERKTS